MKHFYSACSIVAAVSLLSVSRLYAQQTVTGRVTNATGSISGVTVTVKGSTRVTQTDRDGNYSIAAQRGETLRFSIVGYRSQEVLLQNGQPVNVVIKPEDGSLEEVVVTGFAARKRSQIGSAVTVISGEDIRRTGAVNPIAALQGLVPGLQVQPGTGGPQSTPIFRIRGAPH
ncbi:carboxypeptidase-like regulatory domain-containing protein [Sphingobacterium sp. CZ-UAM]|uniref:carboxypeptidase-like regulatory domain-containing protein n=1 Tax=Sphingobacterium sp. CZ-UAM TaxID=1933868 RepID=UPI0020CA1299|nr:carboxypeptidase-like regulatory domain-containing protein [Sphingobacterium sp. CZ-UAM]